MQPIFYELNFKNTKDTTVLFGDNRPAIFLKGNESAKSRRKHMDTRLKFCGEVLKLGLLKIEYIATAENIADIFMNPLPSARFRFQRERMVIDLLVFISSGAVATANVLTVTKGYTSP